MESKPKFRYQTNMSVEETGLGQEKAIEGKLVAASLMNVDHKPTNDGSRKPVKKSQRICLVFRKGEHD